MTSRHPRWISQSQRSGSFAAKDNRLSKENELIALRKEVQQLKWRTTLQSDSR